MLVDSVHLVALPGLRGYVIDALLFFVRDHYLGILKQQRLDSSSREATRASYSMRTSSLDHVDGRDERAHIQPRLQ